MNFCTLADHPLCSFTISLQAKESNGLLNICAYAIIAKDLITVHWQSLITPSWRRHPYVGTSLCYYSTFLLIFNSSETKCMNAAADAEEIHRLALPQSPRLHFSHELENQTAVLFTSTAAASHGNFTTADCRLRCSFGPSFSMTFLNLDLDLNHKTSFATF